MASWTARLTTTLPTRRLAMIVVLAASLTLLLVSCAASANPVPAGDQPAGFWLGLWQGFIAPIAFLVSLVNHAVGIYEVHNSGAWYNFGFLAGLSVFFSGPARARSRARSGSRSRS